MYDVGYFIAKFEGIPESKWCEEELLNEDGRCCALGHCGGRIEEDGDIVYTEEIYALSHLIGDVPAVNDGLHDDYPQSTPKQRILAALRDIKETS